MNPLSPPTQATKTRPTRSVPTKRYEPVALTFRKSGFTYRQIAREGDVCIYEQRWGNSEKRRLPPVVSDQGIGSISSRRPDLKNPRA
jgi:hypothetical protein